LTSRNLPYLLFAGNVTPEAGFGCNPRVSDHKPLLLVLTSTHPRWGGDTEPRFVLDLCARLRDDYRVVVLAPHAAGAARAEVMEGVEVHRFRYAPERWQQLAYEGGMVPKLRARPWAWLLVPVFLVAETLAIARLLRRLPVAVLHAHWLIPQALCAWLACVLARRRPPLVCTVHGADVFSLRGAAFDALRRFILARCAWVGAVSEAIAAELRRLGAGPGQVLILPMGVSERSGPAPARDADHVVFAGRIVEKKGLPVLLRACARLRAQGSPVRLTVAGGGPQLEACRALARELQIPVTFTGPVAHADVLDLFRRATVAVMPSVVAADGDTEGLGLVALEAMMAGCPVIASDLPAVATYLRHDDNGVLFPAGDDAALAHWLLRLIGDEALRQRLAARGQRHARETFGWEAAAAAYRRAYARVLAPAAERSR
jgi:glycosyltransferase involved in cell wall biosynthesis